MACFQVEKTVEQSVDLRIVASVDIPVAWQPLELALLLRNLERIEVLRIWFIAGSRECGNKLWRALMSAAGWRGSNANGLAAPSQVRGWLHSPTASASPLCPARTALISSSLMLERLSRRHKPY